MTALRYWVLGLENTPSPDLIVWAVTQKQNSSNSKWTSSIFNAGVLVWLSTELLSMAEILCIACVFLFRDWAICFSGRRREEGVHFRPKGWWREIRMRLEQLRYGQTYETSFVWGLIFGACITFINHDQTQKVLICSDHHSSPVYNHAFYIYDVNKTEPDYLTSDIL